MGVYSVDYGSGADNETDGFHCERADLERAGEIRHRVTRASLRIFLSFLLFFFLLGTGRSVNEKPMSFRADEQEKVRARKKFFPSVPGLRFFPSGGPRHVEVRRR